MPRTAARPGRYDRVVRVCAPTGGPRPRSSDVGGAPLMADLAFLALTVALFAALALVARKLDRS